MDYASAALVGRCDAEFVASLTECILPTITVALEKLLTAVQENGVLENENKTFNGIDHLAELLWNLNPKYPERQNNWTSIFDIKWPTDKPRRSRPPHPLSWVWTKQEAATIIQAAFRGYMTRKDPAVQELRIFWKALRSEHNT